MADESREIGQDATLREILKTLVSQAARLRVLLVIIYAVALLTLAALVVVHFVADIPLRLFFIDPVAEFSSPMYVGAVSNLGVVLWGSTASACLFGGWLLWGRQNAAEQSRFLLGSAVVSAILLFDDLFLLHEEVLPERLKIPQPIVFVGYGLLVGWLLWRFRTLILESDFVLLVLAAGFFAGSLLVDLFVTPAEFFIFGDFAGRDLIEDGLKFLGIISWTAYFWRVAIRTLRPMVRSEG